MEYYKSTKLTEGEIELIKAGSEYIGEKHGRYQAYTEFIANANARGLSLEAIASLTSLTVGEVVSRLNQIGNHENV